MIKPKPLATDKNQVFHHKTTSNQQLCGITDYAHLNKYELVPRYINLITQRVKTPLNILFALSYYNDNFCRYLVIEA